MAVANPHSYICSYICSNHIEDTTHPFIYETISPFLTFSVHFILNECLSEAWNHTHCVCFPSACHSGRRFLKLDSLMRNNTAEQWETMNICQFWFAWILLKADTKQRSWNLNAMYSSIKETDRQTDKKKYGRLHWRPFRETKQATKWCVRRLKRENKKEWVRKKKKERRKRWETAHSIKETSK